MPNIQHKRGTRAALDALAASSGLVPWQVYAISDESRLALALTTSTYQTFLKTGEGGGGGGAGFYVGPTAPDPATYPLWLNTTDGVFLIWTGSEWMEPGANYVPEGGSAGQVLRKVSGTDFDLQWSSLAISDVSGLQSVIDAKQNAITISATAPVSPTLNQLWFDIS